MEERSENSEKHERHIGAGNEESVRRINGDRNKKGVMPIKNSKLNSSRLNHTAAFCLLPKFFEIKMLFLIWSQYGFCWHKQTKHNQHKTQCVLPAPMS